MKPTNFSSVNTKCSREFTCVNRQASACMRFNCERSFLIYALPQNATSFIIIDYFIINAGLHRRVLVASVNVTYSIQRAVILFHLPLGLQLPFGYRCLARCMAMHVCQIGPTDTTLPCPGSPLRACVGTKGGTLWGRQPFCPCFSSATQVCGRCDYTLPSFRDQSGSQA